MHLTKVDFPDPEGPHITTFCPRITLRLTLSSALNFPKYLETLLISMTSFIYD